MITINATPIGYFSALLLLEAAWTGHISIGFPSVATLQWFATQATPADDPQAYVLAHQDPALGDI